MELGEALVASKSFKLNFCDPRYRRNDGTGGSCSKCGRCFGSQFALKVHKPYCSDLLKWKKEAGVAYEEPNEEEIWLDGLVREHTAFFYAGICLNHLNQESDKEYKLVKPGNYDITMYSSGPIVHLNFRAKPDNGPVETFFAQLKSPFGYLDQSVSVQCLVSLGENLPLPTWGSKHGDCSYCHFPVLHPSPDMKGCENLNMRDPMDDMLSEFDPTPTIPPERLEAYRKFIAEEKPKYTRLASMSI